MYAAYATTPIRQHNVPVISAYYVPVLVIMFASIALPELYFLCPYVLCSACIMSRLCPNLLPVHRVLVYILWLLCIECDDPLLFSKLFVR
jgi:hypothetical protein